MKFSYLIVIFVSFFSLSAYSQGIGGIDDGDSCFSGTRYYRDADGDGYGDPDDSQCALSAPSGYVQNNMDCDDSSALYQPGRWWYRDADGDGFGESSPTTVSCMQPSGYVSNNDDNCPGEAGPDNGCPEPDPLPDPGSFSDENFVFSRIYTKESSSPQDALEEITYYDGLGRPMQHIGIGQAGGSGGEDIITHMGYDDHGRQHKEFLPYAGSGTAGSYRSGAEAATVNYYLATHGSELNSSPNPFSETRFEASPLGRAEEQGAPGAAWAVHPTADTDHTIKFEYERNSLEEVRLYRVSLSSTFVPSLVQSTDSYYDRGQLYKSITKDENWQPGQSNPKDHTTEEFKDKQGRVVLKRTYGDSDVNGDGDTNDSGEQGASHDTYYVYDSYGNLTYVIPPKVKKTDGISTTELNELCYQYHYDKKNRLIRKKIPGKGTATNWESIVYNKLDQPILTQDPNLKAQGKWLYTKYDAFGRVIATGLHTHSAASQSAMQDIVNNYYLNYSTRTVWENKTTTSTNNYYTNQSYPTSANEVLTLNYYDNYTFNHASLKLADQAPVFDDVVTYATKGLPTGSRIKVLDQAKWITTVNHYNEKGRMIYSASYNDFLSTTDKIKHQLDFVGNVLKTETSHKRGTSPAIVTTDHFTYDHVNRLKKHTQSLNGRTEVLAANTYDKLGQLETKGTGNVEGGSRLQEVDYTYNIRGWLKQINNPGTLGGDLFGFKINYNSISHGGTPLFNGNIAETEWKTQNDNVLRWYRYGYDNLNRIISAVDNTADTSYSLSNVDYDKNGNITYLTRKGAINAAASSFGNMDVLSYTYHSNGNRLQRVSDAGNGTYGFVNGVNYTTEYDYDANGNMTKDLNKGIGTTTTNGITYNHLNLPKSVSIGGGTISYIYDATGVKQRKVAGSTTTDYAGNFMYKNNVLQLFNHPEGYVENISGTYKYHYQYKDHLGNIRLSYSDSDGNGAVDSSEIIKESHYYPFGMRHQGYNNVITSTNVGQQFTFNGQQYDESLNLNVQEMTFRQYDPAIGRFNGIDRFAALMPSITPYRFGFNNPILWADPTGLIEESVLMDMYNRSSSGTNWQNDGHSGFYTDNGGYVGYTSDDTALNASPGSSTALPEVTVTLGNQQSYRNAANQIAQNIYKTKWYNDDVDVVGLGISAAGNVSSGFSGFATYRVANAFKSNSTIWGFQNLTASQQAWRTNVVLGPKGHAGLGIPGNALGKYGTKLLKGAKVLGPVATVAGVGYSGYKIYNGTATTIDYADAGVGVASLGAAVFLASNPVGWAVGAGAGVYFAGRFVYDLIEETND